MRKIGILILSTLIVGCRTETEVQPEPTNVELNNVIDTTEIVAESKFQEFPIPNLDDIFPFYETSGMGENAPSDHYYNPTDSGIFVYYSLFDQEKIKNRIYQGDEIGKLITHTYWKEDKGWSTSDTDQTFILLVLQNDIITIGQNIKVGATVDELITELGEPISKTEKEITFLGKENVVGKFKLTNSRVTFIKYGRYNLPENIYEVDSLKRIETIDSIVGKTFANTG